MRKKKKTGDPSRYGHVSEEFMRKLTMRFARSSVRLMLGHYVTQQEVDEMRARVLAHDFARSGLPPHTRASNLVWTLIRRVAKPLSQKTPKRTKTGQNT